MGVVMLELTPSALAAVMLELTPSALDLTPSALDLTPSALILTPSALIGTDPFRSDWVVGSVLMGAVLFLKPDY